MEQKTGIENTKEVLDYLLDFFQMWTEAREDNKIDWFEKFSLAQHAMKGFSLREEVLEVPKEFKDYDYQESQELVAHIMGKLEVEKPKAEAIASRALVVATQIYGLIKELQQKEAA